jgi:Hypoxia induced protein conserved region
MKILTKEEEAAHYNATVTGGLLGGGAGLVLGAGAVYAASARYPAFRSLTLPMKAFLTTSSATFAAIVSADKYSRNFESKRHGEQNYKDANQTAIDDYEARKSRFQRAKDWGKENRYSIVFGSWVASMGTAWTIVGRDPYLTTAQKLVQARVYAQGLTVAVLIASAAFEIGDANKGVGRWETIKVLDPNDPTHKHLIDKRIHHERYAGEDLWKGE